MVDGFRWIGKAPDGMSVVLRKFSGDFKVASYANPKWIAENPDRVRQAVALDVETTGLNKKTDTIIEIGLRPFKFNRATGEILAVAEGFNALQDPGKPLDPVVSRLTGLTDAMLAGKRIDWAKVDAFLAEASLVIAHNAGFDRPFIEKCSKVSGSKAWGCSLKQIDWKDKQYPSSKLEILNIFHGFFIDSHRAQGDADALVHLISHEDWQTRKPYLNELLTNARKPMAKITATGAPFEAKDFLKERGYSWDSVGKAWSKVIFKETLETETAWMEGVVYNGSFRGRVDEIAPTDNFK